MRYTSVRVTALTASSIKMLISVDLFTVNSASPKIFNIKKIPKNAVLNRNVPIKPDKKTIIKNLLVKIFNNTHSRAAVEISNAAVLRPNGVEINNSEISDNKNTYIILSCLLKISRHIAAISITFNLFKGCGNKFAAATCNVKINNISNIWNAVRI